MKKEIKKIIEGNPIALATVSAGKPHVIAVADVKVIGNQLIVGDNYMKETIKNIKKNKNVALAVWNKKGSVGYKLKGTAKYFKKGKWLEMVKKIHKGYPAKGAIIVKINKIKRLA